MTLHADPLRDAGVPDLSPVVAELLGRGHPLLFATVSGAHLYGFPSRDSDVDLRGVHLLPLPEVIGLREGEQTQSRMWDRGRPTAYDALHALVVRTRQAAA